MADIGTSIHRARRQRQMSLSQCAKEAGLAKSALWKIEQGESDPRLSTVAAVAKVLGLPLWSLAGDAPEAVWLGCYARYPWSVAFSSEEAARRWLCVGRQITAVPLDSEANRGA